MSEIRFPTAVRPPQDQVQDQTPRLRPVHKQRSFAGLRTIGALVLREISTTYGRSPSGYFWAVAEPVGGIILLTVIFSAGFRAPPMGTNFAIFYATGILPFMAFMQISMKVANAITYSKALLAYPAVTFMDALLARVFVNVVMQLLVAYLVLSGIMMLYETRTDPQIPGILLAFVMSFTLAVGVGAVNCFMFAAFKWWQPVWSIITRPLFLLSCIFFVFDDVPDRIQPWLWWNPLIHIVGQMRKSFYPSYAGDYISVAYCFAVGLSLMAVGFALLHRYHRDLQYS